MKSPESGRSFDDAAADAGRIDPEGSFLVQLRGGSRIADRDVRGRIEHLCSGQSEAFQSLSELFDFLDRYFGRSGPGSGTPTP